VAATSSVTRTGNIYIDSVLTGTKWAVGSLTFSFPTQANYYGSGYGSGQPGNNFEAFNPEQQAATRIILQGFAAVANVTFTEMTETSTQHATLRLAESNATSTAYAYYPSTAAEGGDAWFNNSKGWYDNPEKGNYAWFTIAHELGHAMGLKHPHTVINSFGKMPVDRDSLEYSVMSYHSHVGATDPYYTNEQWGYPQSLMMYDIAALQTAYGANYSTNAGDTTYSWSAVTGEMFIDDEGQGAPGGNRVFLTIWDGGGIDTYDFSNYATDLDVNLQPGQWTTASSDQLANLGNGHFAAGNIANALQYQGNPASLIENVIGGSGDDAIAGNAADNLFAGGAGNDVLDGRSGVDTVVFSGNASDYSLVTNADGTISVTDLRAGTPDGTDLLKNIQYLQFKDVIVAGQEDTVPVAADDYYATARKTKLVVNDSGVLANDTDVDALSACLLSKARRGTVTFHEDGTFAYKPGKKFVGTDSFTYMVGDGENTASATVYITVGRAGGSASSASARGHKDAALDLHRDEIPSGQLGETQGLQTLFDFDDDHNDWSSLRDLGHNAVSAFDHHEVAFVQDAHLLLK
jgi:serralysin